MRIERNAIRTFAARYHRGIRLEIPLTSGQLPPLVASARTTIFAVIGFVIALAGVAVALQVDRFAGMALLIVGAFLFLLPFARSQDDE